MTDTPAHDKAPSDESETFLSGHRTYAAGLLLSLGLTALSFWAAQTHSLWPPGVPVGLCVLAVAQMGVHLLFFLHITTAPDNTNNILALAFGLIIVFLIVAGSLWIMANFDHGSMTMQEIMNTQS